MNFPFWVVLISLAVILGFGAILALTLYVRANYSSAMQKMSAGKPQEALDLLMRVVGIQQKHVPAMWQAAMLYLSMDKAAAAARNLERIIAIMDSEPDKETAAARWEVTEAQVLSKLAWTLSKLNKRPEGIAYFRRLIEIDPQNKEARFELAKLFYSVRDYDQCIPTLESLIRMDPAHQEAYETLSHALSAKGKHHQAAEVLSKRLALDRSNVNLWIRLANLYRTAKDNAKQAEAWKAVMEMAPKEDPNHISAAIQLGKLSYLEGNYEAAVAKLQAAVTLCPFEDTRTLKSVKYYLGRAYLEQNKRSDAMSAFSEVYAIDPNYKDVREILKDSIELLSDDDIAAEIRRMRMDDFTSLAASIVANMGYTSTSIETVNDADVKVNAKLEETGKDRMVLVYFQRAVDIDVGELAIRSFTVESEEKHVEYPIYFTPGGFSFEAQIRAKDHRVKLMPKVDFCEMIRKVRTAA